MAMSDLKQADQDQSGAAPDPEVRSKPERRRFTADRGRSMMSKPPALPMEDLGIRKSHSRPRGSNDNQFSKSQFKTMKYRPGYPGRCGSLQDARSWAGSFFTRYNSRHYCTGIGRLSPGSGFVHS